MYFDRYDIACAWYHYLSENHGGQYSPEYARLSRLLTWFRPGASEEYLDGISENARAIYDRLIAQEAA